MNSIKNYLFELSDNEYVNNDSPVCLWDLNDLLNKLYSEIKENYKGNIVKLVSSELDVKSQNCRAFYHWLSGECPIPIPKFIKFVYLWKNICGKLDEILSTLWKKSTKPFIIFRQEEARK